MEIKKEDKSLSPTNIIKFENESKFKPKTNIKLKNKKLVILGILIVIVFIVAVYFTFFYSTKCKNLACWEYKLQKCSRAIYVNDIKDITWRYQIIGKRDELCEVNAKVTEVRGGLLDSKVLEGKEMKCMIPEGVIINPESDPNLCYGRLKEEMQGLIIKKLHQYIVSNLGSINQNLTKIEGIGG